MKESTLIAFWPASICVTYLFTRLVCQTGKGSDETGRDEVMTRRAGQYIILWYLHVVISVLLICTPGILCYQLLSGIASSVARALPQEYLAAVLGVWAFYTGGLLPDADEPYTQSTWNASTWIVSLLFESITLIGQFAAINDEPGSPSYEAGPRPSVLDMIFIALGITRIVTWAAMLFVYWSPRNLTQNTPSGEGRPLLDGVAESGALADGILRQRLAGKPADPDKPKDAQTTEWTDYVAGFRKLFPFLWPSDSHALQARVLACFGLLILQRIVNVLVPRQLGILITHLGPGKIPHAELLVYVVLRFFQGQQGVIGSIRAIMWIPISQSTYRRLTKAAYEHVLSLSLEFHVNKRIGDVVSALSKGSALNTFLDSFAFQLFPMVADLWIAALYFSIEFDMFYALVVVCVTWLYIYITIYMAKFRGRARREMAFRDRETEAAKTDALMSYETIHYNGAISLETSRFEHLTSAFQRAEWKVLSSLNFLNAVQNGIFTVGLLVVCYLDAFQISRRQQQVANFVTLLTYLAQLQAPLNFFGSFYTQVQNTLVDAERMLELFNEKPNIVDKIDAVNLISCTGLISFENVHFSYDGREPALDGVSFEVAPGTSTAIVGESGGGKSTLLKLLFRFYDVNEQCPDSGAIRVDGMDIRNVALASLRSHMGIVPQDTILFNDTIMYNLLYAKPDASQEQVHAACHAASIHDKIMSFPAGYDTKVGERGLKLSGGEKQRLSIARAFLRSPRILMLDEATAALDSQTEASIQKSLEAVSEGRTTIMIAHRLSTITNCDQIVVLDKGNVIEKGTHGELLALRGRYYGMWIEQTQ